MEKLVRVTRTKTRRGEQVRITLPIELVNIVGFNEFALVCTSSENDALIVKPVKLETKVRKEKNRNEMRKM